MLHEQVPTVVDEEVSRVAAYGCSTGQEERWNMYGEFTHEEVYGEATPKTPVSRLSPAVEAWDSGRLSEAAARESGQLAVKSVTR